MKNLSILCLSVLLAASALSAGSEYSAEISVSGTSKYLWRGQQLSESHSAPHKGEGISNPVARAAALAELLTAARADRRCHFLQRVSPDGAAGKDLKDEKDIKDRKNGPVGSGGPII